MICSLFPSGYKAFREFIKADIFHVFENPILVSQPQSTYHMEDRQVDPIRSTLTLRLGVQRFSRFEKADILHVFLNSKFRPANTYEIGKPSSIRNWVRFAFPFGIKSTRPHTECLKRYPSGDKGFLQIQKRGYP